jgi:hypothetical protein
VAATVVEPPLLPNSDPKHVTATIRFGLNPRFYWEISGKFGKIDSTEGDMDAATVVGFSRRSTKSPLFSDQQIRQVAGRSSNDIANWVKTTASQRGVSVRSVPNQKFFKAVSRLSDGVVDLDPVEELLVALGRAGVITSFQRGLLQVHYLR